MNERKCIRAGADLRPVNSPALEVHQSDRPTGGLTNSFSFVSHLQSFAERVVSASLGR